MGCIIDTHAHFNDPKFDEYRDELLSSLPSLGVEKIINCGCSDETSLDCIALAEKYPHIYAAVGYHPCSVEGNINIEAIEKMLSHEKVVAVGEIGLDYYWDKTYIAEQKAAFRLQLELARRHNLPVIIHSRESTELIINLLKDCKHLNSRGVFHAFSGSVETYRELQKLGDWYIGIGGVLTYKKASIAETVKEIPLERILLETDSPYLTPVPFRGRRNESSYVPHIATKLAELTSRNVEEIAQITTENARKLFRI